MKTPKRFSDNIAEHMITDEMLALCLYSVNKRAKNMRDKEVEWREHYRNQFYAYDKYNTVGKYREKKEEYYGQKEILLSILEPICMHKELQGYKRRRIYDYEEDYHKFCKKFVWENCFFDHEKQEEVWFGDIELKDQPKYRTYLFYEVYGYSFHSPIDDNKDKSKWLECLEVKEIKDFVTYGAEIKNLISPQFVKKVITLIQSKEYIFKVDNEKN